MAANNAFNMNLSIIHGIPFSPVIDEQRMEELALFELRNDDLFIVTYPKCGTTWMQQLVKLIHARGIDDNVHPMEPIPWLEAMDSIRKLEGKPPIDCKLLPSPRMFKSHFPYFMMPGGEPAMSSPRYIYLARNPKDTAVSFYHHTRSYELLRGYDGGWNGFFERFVSGDVEYGSWFEHVLQWWQHRDSPNILFMKYEDMKKDVLKAVRKLAKFMGCDIDSDTAKSIANQGDCSHHIKESFGVFEMTENCPKPGDAHHFRGIVGEWRRLFSEDQSARMDEMFHKKLAGTGLEFDFG